MYLNLKIFQLFYIFDLIKLLFVEELKYNNHINHNILKKKLI